MIARLEAVLPAALIRGGTLQHSAVPTDGVHRPSFYLLGSSRLALTQQTATAALSGMHNESQRVGFWHLLRPCAATVVEA